MMQYAIIVTSTIMNNMATTMIATTYPAGPLLFTTVFVSPAMSYTGAVVLVTNDGDAFYDT